jgi:hypothetical protein
MQPSQKAHIESKTKSPIKEKPHSKSKQLQSIVERPHGAQQIMAKARA